MGGTGLYQTVLRRLLHTPACKFVDDFFCADVISLRWTGEHSVCRSAALVGDKFDRAQRYRRDPGGPSDVFSGQSTQR